MLVCEIEDRAGLVPAVLVESAELALELELELDGTSILTKS